MTQLDLNAAAEDIDLDGALQRWIDSAPEPAAQTNYIKIAKQIRDCWSDPTHTKLSISDSFYLRDLPPLPPHIKQLDVTGARNLERLPDLSGCKNLESLNLFDCERLREIPDLRALSNLKRLEADYCKSLINPPLVQGLAKLQSVDLIDCTQMTASPDLTGCEQLQELTMINCSQVTQPPLLQGCGELKTLTIYLYSDLTVPPDTRQLPKLENLTLNDCHNLITSPDVRHCEQLVRLQMNNCWGLTSPPVLGTHPQLTTLSMTGVPLRSLPENILSLPADCQVSINAAYLPAAVLSRLSGMMNMPGYAGVRVDYDLAEPGPRHTPTLDQSLHQWRAEGGDTATTLDPKFAWADRLEESDKTGLSSWLSRLRESSEYLNIGTRPEFTKRVNAVLDEISQPDNALLRNRVIDAAKDAVNTCGDRVALALLAVEQNILLNKAEVDVTHGKYDDDPASLVTLGVGMYRLQQLERLAQEKVSTLSFADEIEVHLGYLCKVGPQFNLPIQASSMLYEQHSRIEPEDVARGTARLSNLEKTDVDEGAVAYLSAWNPINLLQRRQRDGSKLQEEKAARIAARQEQLREQVINAPDPATGGLLMEEYNNLDKTVGEEIDGAQIAAWLAQAREQHRI